jgi:diguanylate cyclase (GGDEF)-like protein
VCFVGAIAHIIFLFIFALMDALFMAAFNVVSVIIWIYAFLISQKGDYEKSVHIITVEMFIHAIVATYFVGTDLGFQYYMWPLMALLLSLPSNKLMQSTFYCAVVILAFIVVTLTMRDIEYVYGLTEIINYVYSFNVFFAAAPFVLTILYLRSSSTDREKSLYSQANMDVLTGTFNRRFMSTLMQSSEGEQRRRSFDTYTLVLAEVDHFKQIYESLGREVGDNVVKEIAQVLRNNVRDSDIVCRWAGEEFLLLLANADTEISEKVVYKIRHGIQQNTNIKALSELGLSMSFGIASAHKDMSFEETLRRVDLKLYQARSEGRDRVLS